MQDGEDDQQVDAIGTKADVAVKKDETEEVIPDYEVVEESDDKVTAKSDDDKKLSSTDGGDSSEETRLKNREKRQLKKKKLAEKFDAKDSVIRQQQERLDALQSRLNEVDGRLSTFDQANFTNTWNSSVEAFNAAEAKHAEAFTAGDGAAATAAMREMYQAQKMIDRLEEIKARAPAQPQRTQPDGRAMNKAIAWAAKNEWFKPGGGSEDSIIADAIATALVKEGYDPKTDDYFDELDERLEKKNIGMRHMEQEDDDDEEPMPAPVQKRKSPPVGGGAGRGDLGNGKVKVTLPTEFINALKQNGYWDDPVMKNKMVAGYLRGVKERGNA
jgi:hypothetical protein